MKISGASINSATIEKITTVVNENTKTYSIQNTSKTREIVDTVSISDEGKNLSNLKAAGDSVDASIIAISESIAAAVQG